MFKKFTIFSLSFFLVLIFCNCNKMTYLKLTKILDSHIKGDLIGEISSIDDGLDLPVLQQGNMLIVTGDATRQKILSTFDLGSELIDKFFTHLYYQDKDTNYEFPRKYAFFGLYKNNDLIYLDIVVNINPLKCTITKSFQISTKCRSILGRIENKKSKNILWESKESSIKIDDSKKEVIVCHSLDKKTIYGYYFNGKLAFEKNFKEPILCAFGSNGICIYNEEEQFKIVDFIENKLIIMSQYGYIHINTEYSKSNPAVNQFNFEKSYSNFYVFESNIYDDLYVFDGYNGNLFTVLPIKKLKNIFDNGIISFDNKLIKCDYSYEDKKGKESRDKPCYLISDDSLESIGYYDLFRFNLYFFYKNEKDGYYLKIFSDEYFYEYDVYNFEPIKSKFVGYNVLYRNNILQFYFYSEDGGVYNIDFHKINKDMIQKVRLRPFDISQIEHYSE